MKRKLQVFVSSTFLDLREERQAAVEAILEAGHIPAGMELFSANNKSQLDTIYRWISECDMYMLLLGGRYGTIERESQLSFTELEFQYAIQTKTPHFSLVMTETALENRVRTHGTSFMEKDNRDKYTEFRRKVESYVRSSFSDTKDIKLEVIKSLRELEKNPALSGWVSGRDLSEIALASERVASLESRVHRITGENSYLKAKLKEAEAQINRLRESGNGISLATFRSSPASGIAVGNLALEMLGAASHSNEAIIYVRRTIEGTDFVAGDRIFGNISDHRDVMRHHAAVDELINSGLISDAGVGHGVYQITHLGYQFLDRK